MSSPRWTHERLTKMLRTLVDAEALLPQKPSPGATLRKMHELWAETLVELCDERERTHKARKKH